MTRFEIGASLKSLRDEKKILLKDLCTKLGCMPAHIYRIEKGECNFNIEKAINYLSEMNAQLVLSCNSKTTPLSNNSDCAKYIKNLRKEKSLRCVSQEVKCSPQGLLQSENGKNLISIDLLLKLADYYGFEVRIEKK